MAASPSSAAEVETLDQTVKVLVARLETLAATPDDKLTCDDLLTTIGAKSHALALFIFSLLNLLPSPPGYNFMMGLVIIGLAVLQTVGQPLRLWKVIGERQLPLKVLVKLLGVLRWITEQASRVSTPRLFHLTSKPVLPLIGIYGVLMGLLMLVPIPFTNMLPSISLAMVSVAVLNRDGLLLILGAVVGIAGMVFIVVAVWLVVALFGVVEDAVDGEPPDPQPPAPAG